LLTFISPLISWYFLTLILWWRHTDKLVLIYGGWYVVNLFKQKLVSQKNESSNVHFKLRH